MDHSVSSPARRILAQNTRKLPHPAWGPKTRRTGRRQQEWASKQRPPSETGSSLQDAMGDSSGEKPRNGHGTNLERSKKALELPGTASEVPRKAPERSWLSSLSPNPPTHQTGPRGRGPTFSLIGWSPDQKGKGEGGPGRWGARPRATNDALHAVRSSRRSLSLRPNVSIASTQACPTTKLNQTVARFRIASDDKGWCLLDLLSACRATNPSPLFAEDATVSSGHHPHARADQSW